MKHIKATLSIVLVIVVLGFLFMFRNNDVAEAQQPGNIGKFQIHNGEIIFGGNRIPAIIRTDTTTGQSWYLSQSGTTFRWVQVF